jgi:hypothetical protein
VNPSPSPEVVSQLRATTLVKPVNPTPDVTTAAPEEFRSTGGVGLTTNKPSVKAALAILFETWPRSLAIAELVSRVHERLAPVGVTAEAEELAAVLLNCYLAHLVELHIHEPEFVLSLSEKPTASPVARVLAATEARVPNLRHRSIEVNDLDRRVLCHLDGRHDRAALLVALRAAVAEGVLEIHSEDGGPPDDAQVQAVLEEGLTQCLQRLAGSALLVS